MTNLIDSYCRLCAEPKPSNKQVNLQLNDEKRTEIIKRLTRVNAAANFEEHSLPKTVCFDCISTLNKAYDFVVATQSAQATLNQIFEALLLKKEKLNCVNEKLQGNALNRNNLPKVAVKKESDDEDIHGKLYSSSQESDSKMETAPSEEKPSKKQLKLDADFNTLSRLSPLKLSWENYSWYCGYCETPFTSIDELKNHSIESHKICNPYQCTDCKIRRLKLDDFLSHVQRHHKYLKYSCYKCFEKFKTRAERIKHIAIHLTTKFICSGCKNSFENNEELLRHMNEFCHLNRGRIPLLLQADELTCKICQKSYKTKRNLSIHEITHTDRKAEHVCEVCGKGFFFKYNLGCHSYVHKEERPHKCHICNFACKSARLLKEHIGIHNRDKPHACAECGRCFRLRTQLNRHSIVHTDIQPYSCPHCQKRFRFKNVLNGHVRVHTGAKPYTCEPCQRDFTSWSNYNKHMKRKHNMDTAKKKHYMVDGQRQ